MYLKTLSDSQDVIKHSGKNFSSIHPGRFDELEKFELKHPLVPERPVRGKLFLKDHLNLTGMQVSYGSQKPGGFVPFNHKHKANEELYIFISGRGQMQVDGEIIDVQEGSAVRVSPEGERSFRNIGDVVLHYIVIQAKAHSLENDTFDDGMPCSSKPIWPSEGRGIYT